MSLQDDRLCDRAMKISEQAQKKIHALKSSAE
jgi:hypothetical protein